MSFFGTNKKGAMQLSMSIIIILILSIVVFTGGMYLVGQFFKSAEKIEAKITAQTQSEVEARLMQTGDPITIPFNKRKLKIGESHAFALGVLNTYPDTGDFNVEMSFSNAFDTVNPSNPLTEPDQEYINENWIFSELPTFSLKRNEINALPLNVQVQGEMANGVPTKRGTTFVFNICVYYDKAVKGVCKYPKITRLDRDELHGKRVGKVYVVVD